MYGPVVTAVLLVCGIPSCVGEQLCLVGGFSEQVRVLQRRVMLSPLEVSRASRLYDDMRRTLRRRWKDAEIFPYGSLTTGVAMKTSDADCSFKIPNNNAKSEVALVAEAAELFRTQSDLYSQVTVLTRGHRINSTYITVYHNPTNRYSDVIYNNEVGVNSTRLVRYFINLDERIPPLLSILKFWSRIHQITGPAVLTNYGLYTLLIFYLQQKKIVPPVFYLQKDLRNNVVGTWDLSFNEIPYNTTNTESLYHLLGGFFKYYSEFDFKEYIVSPFVGRPLHRREFAHIDNVPAEFSLYKAFIRANFGEPLYITTDICIQEPFQHNKNSAYRVAGAYTTKIISHFKFGAKMYEQLSSDRFLRSILIKDKHTEKYERAKMVVLDQISKLKDCVNATLN